MSKMSYPIYYKSRGKLTALLGDNKFVQINRLTHSWSMIAGRNKFTCDDCVRFDKEISEDEFLGAVKEFENFVQSLY